MNKYPQMTISKDKIRQNVRAVKGMCDAQNIELATVTKIYCGIPEVTDIYVQEGVKCIADSRIENLQKYTLNDSVKKLLLRVPMLSEMKRISENADMVLISEIEAIRKLNEEAVKKMGIIIMIDLGDLREGIFNKEELHSTVEETLKMNNIELLGFGTNLSCYGGVLPTEKNMNHLVDLIEEVETKFGFKSQIISGGNSGILSMLERLPDRINQIRVGASVTAGIGLNDEPIKGTSQEAFQLEAEVVEIKIKPSVPIGEQGLNAFGEKPYFEDLGDIKHVICAIGRQDVNFEDLTPLQEGVKILGSSSDHLIIDVTNCKDEIKLGSIMRFNLSYGGILSLATSEYVNKKLI